MAFAGRCGLTVDLDPHRARRPRGPVQRGAGGRDPGASRGHRRGAGRSWSRHGLAGLQPRSSATLTEDGVIRFLRRRPAGLRGQPGRAAAGLVRDQLPASRPCATTRSVPARSSSASAMRPIWGLSADLGFDPERRTSPPPIIAEGARPAVAVLREQGVNGQVEMAAAFHRAGFECVDVHLSDIIAGRADLDRLPRPGRLRRLLLRRRAGCRRGLGQVHPVQPPGPGPVPGLLRALRHLQPWGSATAARCSPTCTS